MEGQRAESEKSGDSRAARSTDSAQLTDQNTPLPHPMVMIQTCYRNTTLCILECEYKLHRVHSRALLLPYYYISTKCTNGESSTDELLLSSIKSPISTLQSDEAAWIVAYLTPLQALVPCSSLRTWFFTRF